MDRREAILDRLHIVLQSIPGTMSHPRNRGELQHDKRPSVVLLDGSEDADDGAFSRGRGTVIKNLVVLRPEIYVLLKNQKPNNEGIGPELNSWRAKVFNAVTRDSQLLSLLGTNGGIHYLGCETDMQSGRPMQGELRVDFAFTYVLDPRELAEES